MDNALDMPLDDIIKTRKSAARGRGRGGSQRGRGGSRHSFVNGRKMNSGPGRLPQGPLRVNTRPSASTIAKPFRRPRNFPWKQDLFEESLVAAGLPSIEDGTKLHVTNLDIRVSSDDIRDIFSAAGELKRYALHYDKNGAPSGSAEVVFVKRSDAFYAMKRYNNVKLDGRPLKIEVISPNPRVPVSPRVNVTGGSNGGSVRRVVITPGGSHLRPRSSASVGNGPVQRGRGGMRNNTRGRGRGHGWGQPQNQGQGQSSGRGRGRIYRKKQQPKEKSAAELDKELEKYHAEAMETS